jgi:putative endonuclease
MSYFVYILRSRKDKKRYIGFTEDLKERLRRHNAGGVKSTKNRRPVELIEFRRFSKLSEALLYEKKLKGKNLVGVAQLG